MGPSPRATVRPPRAAPGPLTLSEADRRTLATWAADCAERVLPLFEAEAPGDGRPRAALDGLRRFARGEALVGEIRTLSVASHAAARSVTNPAAAAAAAAARAAGQAAGTAHMAAHARGAPAYAIVALDQAGRAGDPVAEEIAWQLDRATPAVRAALRRLPPQGPGGGRLGELIRALDASVANDR